MLAVDIVSKLRTESHTGTTTVASPVLSVVGGKGTAQRNWDHRADRRKRDRHATISLSKLWRKTRMGEATTSVSTSTPSV